MTITNGYTTLAEVTALLDVTSTDTDDDTVIEEMITQASRIIDNITGRQFYGSTDTMYFDCPVNTRELPFGDLDCLSITTVTNGDAETVSSSDYTFMPRNHAPYYGIRLTNASGLTWYNTDDGDSVGAISIDGNWGYSTDTPADIEAACQEIVISAYKKRYGANETGTAQITSAGVVITPADVPATAMRILRNYTRIV